jgi:hypothetical protein
LRAQTSRTRHCGSGHVVPDRQGQVNPVRGTVASTVPATTRYAAFSIASSKTLEAHVRQILLKLDLPESHDDHRRVLAVC